MPTSNRRAFVRRSAALAALAAMGGVGRAGAQGLQPLDVVKIITGFPPGGTSDTLCRRVAEGLKGTSYTKIALVENKAGATGNIATDYVAQAKPDGYTVLLTSTSGIINQISGNVRIVTICDIYAALIERRPYKAPMRSEQALAVLSDMGGKLDRELVKYFESAVAGTK